MIDILMPVLGRPHRVGPLIENIELTTTVPHRILFLCSAGDGGELEAVQAAGADYLELDAPPAQGQYAKKINLGYRSTEQPWLLLGADDVVFHRGWADAALATAGDKFSVVATNDRANSHVRMGLLATHSLVSRAYVSEQGASLDGPGVVYHEGYSHNFVDCELSVLARRRGVFVFARRSVLQHVHPVFRRAPMDATYEAGLRDFVQDRQLFVERMTPDYLRDTLVRPFAQAVQGVDPRRGRRR